MSGHREALQKIYQSLLAKRRALREALDIDLELTSVEHIGVGDECDVALDCEQNEVNSQLAALESRELLQIEDALRQFKQGKYGVCTDCGEPIAVARLKALPFTTLCIQCQREEEAHGSHGSRYSENWESARDFGNDGDEPDVKLDEFEMESET